jgi:uncharacterized membrane protein (DUF4010 family)
MDGIGTATLADVVRLVVGALGGAAVGLERQWSGHASGADARFAGIRTFTLLGVLGALSGWVYSQAAPALAIVVLAGAAALVVAGYVAASHHDVDATTEVAAIVVLTTGMLAGLGQLALSSGLVSVTTLLLIEKTRLHGWVARIDDRSIRAGLRFAVMAMVVLPLLPAGPLDPFGWVRPRQLWALVLFFSGLSFIGYIARMLVGPRHGYAMAGLLGGFVSSTNVSLTFSRLSRDEPESAEGLATGVVAASTFVFLRVMTAVAVLNVGMVADVAWYLLPPLLVGIVLVSWRVRRPRDHGAPLRDTVQNPLQLGAALQMAVIFQMVLIALPIVQRYLGAEGIVASAAVLGLTDTDALTMSLARGAADVGTATAALAIAVGVLTNTFVKLGIVLGVGGGSFRTQAAAGLTILAASAGVVLLLVR